MIYFIILLISPFVIFGVMVCYHFIIIMKKGKKIPVPISNYKPESKLKEIFFNFPKMIVNDKFNRDPNAYPHSGLIICAGSQGSGKTMAAVELMTRHKKMYPKLFVRTNFYFKGQNSPIKDWRDIVSNHNGIYGQIDCIDEIQAWFSSNQSKDFPPEMLAEVSQQRKQRKMILATSQVFGRVAKPIREQVKFVYLPKTILGCLTYVRISRPEYYDENKMIFKKFEGSYFFVHTKELRDSFDTYRKIESLKKSGFNDRKFAD